jgi:hypothetical protein
MNSTKHALSLLLGLVVVTRIASGQVTLTGTGYRQAFDGIGSGLPTGWSVRTNASSTNLGTSAAFVLMPTNWGASSGQFANYASTANCDTNLLGTESTAVQGACTNRCMGVRQTGTFGDPGAAFVLQIQSTLGLANLQLTLDLNLLSVQSRTNAWVVDYGVGTSPTQFIPVWTNTDTGAFGAVTRTVSFGTALDNQPQSVWIRVAALAASTGAGTRDTFGIDNVVLTYSQAGTVVPIPLQIRQIGTNAVLTWTNAAFALQSAPAAAGAYAAVPGATSPWTNPITALPRFFRLKAN